MFEAGFGQMHAIQALLDALPSGVSDKISPNDAMYQGDREHYFSAGQSALRAVKLAMLCAAKQELKHILDLPCGHARVLRFFVAAFPNARITACDLSRAAVDFCAEQFDAIPAYSREQPNEIQLAGPFDLIWCGSLLTHLPSCAWIPWLNLFNSVLAPEGILIFTTHGRWPAERIRNGDATYELEQGRRAKLLADYDRQGFGYQDYADGTNFGISLSSPEWVCSTLDKLPEVRLLNFTERGWDNHQDVISCTRQIRVETFR